MRGGRGPARGPGLGQEVARDGPGELELCFGRVAVAVAGVLAPEDGERLARRLLMRGLAVAAAAAHSRLALEPLDDRGFPVGGVDGHGASVHLERLALGHRRRRILREREVHEAVPLGLAPWAPLGDDESLLHGTELVAERLRQRRVGRGVRKVPDEHDGVSPAHRERSERVPRLSLGVAACAWALRCEKLLPEPPSFLLQAGRTNSSIVNLGKTT